MTRTEIERLAVVEEKVDTMKEGMERIENKLDKFIECADSKYASKLTERIVYGLAGVMLLAVIYALLRMVGL